MLAYLRRNTVAFAALLIAIIALGSTSAYAINTIRSADIVDGAVKRQDLAANAVGNGKIQDNSVLGADIRDGTLTGRDIDESSLSRVPDAARVAGIPATALFHGTGTQTQPTSSCMGGVDIWSACAQIPIVVPAGHTWQVTVWSSVIAHTTAQAGSALFCPAFTGPTCLDEQRIGTFWANGYTTAAASDTRQFTAGTYVMNTAIKFPMAIATDTFALTTTTIEVYDVAAHDFLP